MTLLRTAAPALALLLAAPMAHAGSYYFTGGGWGYDAKGTVTQGGELDFKDDLHLEVTNKKELTLGYLPDKLGFIPGVDFSYVQLKAKGSQVVSDPVVFAGITLADGVTADSNTDINDLDASLRWPFTWNKLTASAGVSIVYLDGSVLVSNADTGERNRQPINQLFPLASLGLSYSPLHNLRLSTRADYVEYQGNKAQTVEAAAFWQLFGPVGIEAGWRQRRFKIDESNGYRFDARLSGARVAIRFELAR